MCFGVVGVFGVVCEFNVFKMICMSLIKILFCVKRGKTTAILALFTYKTKAKEIALFIFTI